MLFVRVIITDNSSIFMFAGDVMLKKMNEKDFSKVFDLMLQSFPDDERRTFDDEKALLENPYFQIYVLPNDDETDVKGVITVWDFEKFAYVDHFAVNPNYRNGGIGTKMLTETVEKLAKTVCLEVEPPENETAKRRIAFYERNNFFLNEYSYMQPPISKGKNAIKLKVMTYGKHISQKEFDEIKAVLYKNVYGVSPTEY